MLFRTSGGDQLLLFDLTHEKPSIFCALVNY